MNKQKTNNDPFQTLYEGWISKAKQCRKDAAALVREAETLEKCAADWTITLEQYNENQVKL